MAYVYRNRNTAEEVSRPEPSARLERLENWELISQPKGGATDPPGGGEGSGSGPDAGERPARSANKDIWLAYARTRVQGSEEEAALEGLTKDQLIERYGEQ